MSIGGGLRTRSSEARLGFMERPHIPELLAASKSLACTVDLNEVTENSGSNGAS